MSTYEIFDLLYDDFKNTFDGDDIVFTQRYVVGQQQIRVYQLKDSSKTEFVKALDFLTGYKKSTCVIFTVRAFFKTFEARNGICVFEFFSLNKNKKELYEQFCDFAIS